MNLRQKMIFIVTDILILIELTACIYVSSGNPEYQTAIFLKLYVPMAFATVVTARILFKWCGRTGTAEQTAEAKTG